MARGQRATAITARISVPVSADEQRRAAEYLDALGLRVTEASKAEIIHSYFVRGLQVTEREVREQAQLDAYTAFESDPERRAVAADINRAALESGAL